MTTSAATSTATGTSTKAGGALPIQHQQGPVVVLDGNTIWHRKLAEALGAHRPTVIVRPAGSGRILPRARPDEVRHGVQTVALDLPRGWASALAPAVQRWLARWTLKWNPQAVMVVSPAYKILAQRLAGRVPLIYHCADDYASYAGWPASTTAWEAELLCWANAAVFVSETLRERAVSRLALDPAKTFVVPNATEPRFLATQPHPTPALLEGRARPVVGVLGAITARLDRSAIRAAADHKGVGTVLAAGPLDDDLAAAEPWLKEHPKLLITGRLAHEEMHHFASAMDVALIPYAQSTLNRHCSPLRLYDHLATGVPIVATDACDQINRLTDGPVFLAAEQDGAAGMNHALDAALAAAGAPSPATAPVPLMWQDRAAALSEVISHTINHSLDDAAWFHGVAP